jgi:hypothetical protein
MRKIFCYCFIPTLIFTACQKELGYSVPSSTNNNNNNGTTGNSITGIWNFLSMQATTQTTGTFNLSGVNEKTISTSDYTTANNTGTLVIGDSIITMSNLSYTVESTVKEYTYENNVLIDSSESPFSFSMPVSNSSGKHKLIGSDSIYFPEGSIMTVSGISSTSQPSGAKLNISGNTMKIIQTVYADTTEDVDGASYHLIETATATMSFQKQ